MCSLLSNERFVWFAEVLKCKGVGSASGGMWTQLQSFWAGHRFEIRVESVIIPGFLFCETRIPYHFWHQPLTPRTRGRLVQRLLLQRRLQREMNHHLQWIILSLDKMLCGITQSLQMLGCGLCAEEEVCTVCVLQMVVKMGLLLGWLGRIPWFIYGWGDYYYRFPRASSCRSGGVSHWTVRFFLVRLQM